VPAARNLSTRLRPAWLALSDVFGPSGLAGTRPPVAPEGYRRRRRRQRRVLAILPMLAVRAARGSGWLRPLGGKVTAPTPSGPHFVWATDGWSLLRRLSDPGWGLHDLRRWTADPDLGRRPLRAGRAVREPLRGAGAAGGVYRPVETTRHLVNPGGPVIPDDACAPVRVWRSGDTSGLANENITLQAFGVLRRPTVQTFTQGTASPRVVELRRTGERGGAPERPLAPADQGSGPGAQPPQSATWECPPRQARPTAPRDPRPPRGGT
jgi:hypothetical protein